VATPAAFVAGTIVSAAVMIDAPPMVKWAAAVIAGGGVAGLTQGLTGILRAHSTVLTGGLGNPVIATAELGGAVLISFLALAAPVAAIALVVLFLFVAMRFIRRRFRGDKSSTGLTYLVRCLPCFCRRTTPEIRTRRKPSRLIIDNPPARQSRILGFFPPKSLARLDLFLRVAVCGEQNLGFRERLVYFRLIETPKSRRASGARK
jgi:Domain of unknown function (DUF4126)